MMNALNSGPAARLLGAVTEGRDAGPLRSVAGTCHSVWINRLNVGRASSSSTMKRQMDRKGGLRHRRTLGQCVFHRGGLMGAQDFMPPNVSVQWRLYERAIPFRILAVSK